MLAERNLFWHVFCNASQTLSNWCRWIQPATVWGLHAGELLDVHLCSYGRFIFVKYVGRSYIQFWIASADIILMASKSLIWKVTTDGNHQRLLNITAAMKWDIIQLLCKCKPPFWLQKCLKQRDYNCCLCVRGFLFFQQRLVMNMEGSTHTQIDLIFFFWRKYAFIFLTDVIFPMSTVREEAEHKCIQKLAQYFPTNSVLIPAKINFHWILDIRSLSQNGSPATLDRGWGWALQGDPSVTRSMCYQDYKTSARFLIFLNT